MIISLDNKKIQLVKSLSKKKFREKYNMFIGEGERFTKEIPSDIHVECTLVSEEFSKKTHIEKYVNCSIVENKIFKKIALTKSSQGIIVICKKKKYELGELLKKEKKFLIICDEVREPGNLGTIIRTAQASNVDGLILSKGCADPYNPKVVRATAGAIFRLPIIENIDLKEIIPVLKEKKIKIVGTDLNSKINYCECDFTDSFSIIIGNEANGIDEQIKKMCDELVIIPIKGEIESLNVSVASGILMYEVVRQRDII